MGRRFTGFYSGHAAAIFALVFVFFLAAASPGFSGQEQGAPEPARKKTDWPWQDPAPGKVVASQTAFVQEKGTFNFNFSTTTLLDFSPVLNIFDVTYGVTRDFEIRASVVVPTFLFLGVGIFPKYSIQLSEYFRMGYMLDFSVVQLYYTLDGDCGTEWGKDICQTQLVYGGAPLILTIGNRNYFANLSLHVVNYKGFTDDCLFSSEGDPCEFLHNQVFVIPSIAASIRISKRVKFNFELMYLYKHDRTRPFDYTRMKHMILPAVGLKIIGKRFYGDINVMVNISKGDEGWRFFFPPALPVFDFGFIYPWK